MRILIIIMLLCTTLVPNYLYAISHENYSEESFLFVGEDYMQENYKVTLHLSGVSVSTLFNEIQKQTKLDFVYNTELLETITPISVTAEKESVFDVLNRLFNGTGFIFKKSGNIITVNKKEELQQDDKFLVTGEVKDDTGEPLVGVTIQQKDTRNITITDMDGRYSIQVSSKAEAFLTFSFVGMKTKTVPVKGRVLNVKLVQDAISIDDVVVVGAYGTAQKRLDQVGSAFQVNADQLKALPALRVDKMLDGLIPGVKIDPNTDSPDNTRARYNVRVRGDASLSASNEPLWVVDGTPIYTGEHTNLIPGMSTTISPLSFINPDDIESITVLKDATATSIYGANGANGVILITTKKGKEGDLRIHLTAQYGVAKIDKSTSPKVLNANQYLMLAKEAYQNAGNDLKYFPYTDNEMNKYSLTNTDWTDVFYDTANTFQTNLSLMGGARNTAYYLSASYLENTATVKGNKQQRFSIRSNLDFTFLRKFKVSVDLATSYNVNDLFNPGRDYYEYLPIFEPYNEDGTFRLYNKVISGKETDGSPKWSENRFLNSVAEREENIYNQKTLYTNANLMLRYDILSGLSYTGQFGVDYQSGKEEIYYARTNWSGMTSADGPIGYSTRNSLNMMNWTTVHRINYKQSFDKHDISGLLGIEAGSQDYVTLGVTGSGFINDHIQDVSYAKERKGTNTSKTKRKASMLGQLSYSYDHRYYVTLNGRRDGNSQFGSDVRWANFGSIGVSWNVQNESFYNIPWMNILKIKASYGANGNSRLGSQEALGLYSYGESYSYAGEIGGVMSGCPNSRLSWETTYMTNIGVRVRLFDRLDIEVEGYHNKTTNLLSNLDVSRTTGDTRVYRNVGTILNKGIEVTITSHNFRPKKDGDFSWLTDLNLAHNSNKLLELYNGIQKNMGEMVWREGYDIHTYNLVRWAGVDPRDGAPLWYDAKGNITRIYSTDNRVPYKSSTPVLAGGLTNTLTYKDFSVRFMFNYSIGGYGFTSFGRASNSDGLNIMTENQSIDQLNRWQKSGDLVLNPKPIWGVSTQSVMNSTRYLYNKTQVRLQNLVFSYRIPRTILHSTGLKDCSISLIGDNLWVWTPYSGKDHNSYKTCMSGYPMERYFSIALNVGL